MVKKKPESKKYKNILTTVAPDDYSFVKKHNLRWADLLRTGIDFARQKVEREEREKYFDDGFARIEDEIKDYLKENNLEYNKETYKRAIYITRGQYTFGDLPFESVRDRTVFEVFLNNYIDNLDMRARFERFMENQENY